VMIMWVRVCLIVMQMWVVVVVAVVMTVAVFMFLFNFHGILLLNLLISYALRKYLLFSLTGASERIK